MRIFARTLALSFSACSVIALLLALARAHRNVPVHARGFRALGGTLVTGISKDHLLLAVHQAGLCVHANMRLHAEVSGYAKHKIDAGTRPGITGDEHEWITAPEHEVKELHRARAKMDETLLLQIHLVWHQLKRQGVAVARCTVQRLI